jgi:hypothetical protein
MNVNLSEWPVYPPYWILAVLFTMQLLFTGSKYLEYISRIRIQNN